MGLCHMLLFSLLAMQILNEKPQAAKAFLIKYQSQPQRKNIALVVKMQSPQLIVSQVLFPWIFW